MFTYDRVGKKHVHCKLKKKHLTILYILKKE